MQILHYTDDYGWPREVVVKTTFRDEEGRRFAVIPCGRGPYDTQPPFRIIEIGRNGAKLSKAVTA